MRADLYYTSVDLFYIALPIFIFSFVFQFLRYKNYYSTEKPDGWYKQWLGPEFSHWVEYLCTSPLQIFIVSVAFGMKNIHTLLGQ